MRIAILYICTGRYNIFWNSFFESCEKYFLSDHERHYYVFTDGNIKYTDNPRVHRVEQPRLGWPYDTLKRFEMFSKVRDELESYDLLFFLNANVLFLEKVEESSLPTREEGLVMVRHPGFYNKPRCAYTYETNPESLAFIPPDQGTVYVCGGVNGGWASPYLAMVDTLKDAIIADEKNGIIAAWHDESHINKYILSHPYKLLSPAFCYPQERYLPFHPVVLIQDKNRFGGHGFLRNTLCATEKRGTFSSRKAALKAKHLALRTTRYLHHLYGLARIQFKFELSLHNPRFKQNLEHLYFNPQSECLPNMFYQRALPTFLGGSLLNTGMAKRIPEGYAKSIYACHFLDGLSPDEVWAVLKRWYVLLKTDGVLRISMLDKTRVLEQLERAREEGDPARELESLNTLYGLSTSCYGKRKSLFSKQELSDLLCVLGFRNIHFYENIPHFITQPPFSSSDEEVWDSSLTRDNQFNLVSFNIEACK